MSVWRRARRIARSSSSPVPLGSVHLKSLYVCHGGPYAGSASTTGHVRLRPSAELGRGVAPRREFLHRAARVAGDDDLAAIVMASSAARAAVRVREVTASAHRAIGDGEDGAPTGGL